MPKMGRFTALAAGGVLGLILFGLMAGFITLIAVTQDSGNENDSETAPNEWFVYALDNQITSLVQANSDGSTQTLGLGLGQDAIAGPMAFNDAGTQTAFCYFIRQPNTPPDYNLIIRDLQAESNLLEMSIGQADGCQVTEFGPNNDQIALSVVNYAPYAQNPDTSQPAWFVRIIDLSTGETLHELNADDPQAPDLTEYFPDFRADEMPLMADVRYFGEGALIFAGIPWIGSGGVFDLPAFRWDYTAGEIAVLDEVGIGNFGADYLPETGESVWSELDESIPNAEPMGMGPRSNVVKFQDVNGNIRTIYQNTEAAIVRTTFVNDGRQIAILLAPGADPDNPPLEQTPNRYVLLSRDGTVTEIDREFVDAAYAANAPGGTALFWSQLNRQQREQPINRLALVDGEGNLTQLWEYQTPSEGRQGTSFLSLVYAPPVDISDETAAGLAPFPIVNP